MKSEWIEGWRRLGEWQRREMVIGSRESWVNSGIAVIGWERCSGVTWREGVGSGEGEMMVMNIIYYMEWIRGLIGGGEFSGYSEGEEVVIQFRHGEEVWVGRGLDRELAFLGLLYEIGEWYWCYGRPSLGEISITGVMEPYGVDVGKGFEFEIGESLDGMEIYFSEAWAARLFCEKWGRFMLERGEGRMMGDRCYHGKVLLVEGEFMIYSPEYPNYYSSASCSGVTSVAGVTSGYYGKDILSGYSLVDLSTLYGFGENKYKN